LWFRKSRVRVPSFTPVLSSFALRKGAFLFIPVHGMKGLQSSLPILMLIGLPLIGIGSAGRPVASYLELPPSTQYVQHAPFAWPICIGMVLALFAESCPFLMRVVMTHHPKSWIAVLIC